MFLGYSLDPSRTVVEPKSVCLTHREVKQTEMFEFRAEKGLLQGPSKEKGEEGIGSKDPNSPMAFRQGFLKTVLGERVIGCMIGS